MKNRKCFILLLGMMIIATASACGKDSGTRNNNVTTTDASKEETSAKETSVKEPFVEEVSAIEIEEIYPANEYLNRFINNYNQSYPDNMISMEEITVDPDLGDRCIYIDFGEYMENCILQGYQNSPIIAVRIATIGSDYEKLFPRIMKGFDPSFSDMVLEEYWNQAVEDLENTKSNEDVNVYINLAEDGTYTDDTICFILKHGSGEETIGELVVEGQVR